jgi:hypothetical protein
MRLSSLGAAFLLSVSGISHATAKNEVPKPIVVGPKAGAPIEIDTLSTAVKHLPLTKIIDVPPSFLLDPTAAKQSKFDQAKWNRELDPEGTELFTSKEKLASRMAVTRSGDGCLESVSIFKIQSPEKTAKYAEEESGAALFSNKGEALSVTRCEDNKNTSSVGRACVTATPELCKRLKSGDPITSEVTKEVDGKEMRALTMILTLRGPDHQLDNVIRSGNRLGLKSGLQTTTGLLLTLAKFRGPDALIGAKMPGAVLALVNHNLPRLKESCVALGF